MAEIDKREQREFFDVGYQEGTTAATTRIYDVFRASKERYKQFLAPRCSGKSVLEYGCGMDSSAVFFTSHGARYTGIDISEVGVEFSRRHAAEHGVRDAEFLVRDAEATEFPDNSFDVVCGWGILHHLRLDQALREIRRILRPDGMAIFIEPLAHNPAVYVFRKLTPGLRTRNEHPLTWSDLSRMEAQFTWTSSEYFHLFTLLGVPLVRIPAARRVVQALGGLDTLCFRCLPVTRRLAWQVLLILEGPRKDDGGRALREG